MMDGVRERQIQMMAGVNVGLWGQTVGRDRLGLE